jgi:hypothetical protein
MKSVVRKTFQKSAAMHTTRHAIILAVVLLLCGGVTAAPAADLTGTWRGIITGEGETGDVDVTFTEAGLPLYTYTNNKGAIQEVELIRAGQKIEFAPPGGGVQKVLVESIRKEPGRVVFSLAGSFEKARGASLEQQTEQTTIEYRLIPQGLHMRVTTRSVSHVIEKEKSVSGSPQTSVAEGVLQKVR